MTSSLKSDALQWNRQSSCWDIYSFFPIAKTQFCKLGCFFFFFSKLGVGKTADFGIDPIPSDYRASIADTDTDTFYLKIPDHWMILYFCL